MKRVASLIALAALVSAGPVGAQDIRVGWSDLDLGSPAGVEAFDKRAHAAAARFCARPFAGTRIIRADRCQEQVRRAAVAGLPRDVQADYAQARQSLSI